MTRVFYYFDNWKDNPDDIWDTDYSSDNWKPECVTIKSDTGQHLQFLQCLNQVLMHTNILWLYLDIMVLFENKNMSLWKKLISAAFQLKIN